VYNTTVWPGKGERKGDKCSAYRDTGAAYRDTGAEYRDTGAEYRDKGSTSICLHYLPKDRGTQHCRGGIVHTITQEEDPRRRPKKKTQEEDPKRRRWHSQASNKAW
jgi:hypothetical protein